MSQQNKTIWAWDVYLPITHPEVRQNTYVISRDGKIKDRVTDKVINENTDTRGFKFVPLLVSYDCKKDIYDLFMVDELVAWAFVPENREFGNYVFHLDGNYSNNNYENLEWTSWDLDPDLVTDVMIAKGEIDLTTSST